MQPTVRYTTDAMWSHYPDHSHHKLRQLNRPSVILITDLRTDTVLREIRKTKYSH